MILESNGDILIGEWTYNLNKSKSKYMSVNLSRDFEKVPCVKISGNKIDEIILTEDDWRKFLKYQGIITDIL